jgi:hypothetical protein
MKFFKLLILIVIFPANCFADKVPCSADIVTEYNIGMSSAAYIGVNISAENTLSEPVDGVTWVMHSKSGKLLFSETWVGVNQRPHFNLNPKLVGIVPIGPGDTTALAPVAIFNHMEFLIRDKQDSNGNEMQEIFEKRLSEAKGKYLYVTCEVLGFVKKMAF